MAENGECQNPSSSEMKSKVGILRTQDVIGPKVKIMVDQEKAGLFRRVITKLTPRPKA